MKRLKRFLLSTMVGGIIVLLPIGILIFIFKFIFDFIYNLIRPLSHTLQLNLDMGNIVSNVVALSIIIAICFVTGFFVTTKLGNFLYHYIDNTFLSKIPGYKLIKDTVTQLSSNNMKESFSKVALADVYDTGSLSTVFVIEKTDDLYTVFIPTGPNPTSGNIFHVPESRVYLVDVKIDEAMKSIIAVGLGSSSLIKCYKDKLLTDQNKK